MGEQPPSLEALGGWRTVLGRLAGHGDLTQDEARAAMAEILEGAATPAQIAGFVVALRMKGETIEELDGFLDAMLAVAAIVEVSPAVHEQLVDVVGTGGDRSHTINVSTLSALVVAGAGVPVCKHGNRAASSSCGAADLLEALGVALELDAAGVARCIEEAGIGFCFAPRFHPALRHAGPARRELAIPTTFNFLGPLANPARARRQLVGVSDPSMADLMLGVLAARGSKHVLLVHGHDGLDELTTTTTSTVHELDDGDMRTWVLDPQDVGIPLAKAEDLRGGDPATNAAIARAVLAGETGPPRDVVLLNAGAALVAAGTAVSVAEGITIAAKSIDEGKASAALDRLVAVSSAAL